jgi:hypothetical protein
MTEASRFSAGEFLFNAPLYTVYTVTPADLTQLLGQPVDGYCPYCHKPSTFTSPASDAAARARLANALRGGTEVGNGNFSRAQHILCQQDKLTITCARSESHSVQFVFRLDENMQLQKIGQFPSLADIAIDESKTYRTVLTPEDSSEFHKAIGLAAHGVGIGSVVYLRRIFERLIIRRFEEFKTVEGWADDDFPNRMADRVDFLRAHLPPFLVENSRIYSILSLGLHELDEEQCLRFFPILKASIIWILDEDKKKKEELQLRNSLKKAIAEFTPESPTTKAPDIKK